MKIVFTPGYDMAPSYHGLVKKRPDKFFVNKKLQPNAVKFFIKEGILKTGSVINRECLFYGILQMNMI